MHGAIAGRRRRVAALLVLLTLLAGACTGGEEEAQPTPEEAETSEPQASEESEESEESPSPRPSPSRSPEPALEARYYQDSDGNVVPDFLEQELGYDPLLDDCALATDCPGVTDLTGQPITAEQNVLLALDASGSMAGADPSGAVKIDAARAALERYVVGTPDSFGLGLLVYGHRGSNEPSGKAESCAGIDIFSPLGDLTVESVPGVLAQFSPTGYTPIAGALDRAAEAFAGREGQANRIILVSDGIETCDGDPVAAAIRLKAAGIAVTVDVVGFDVPGGSDQNALRAIAEATGGTYTNAADANQLDDYFNSLLDRQTQLLNTLGCVLSNTVNARSCVQRLGLDAARALQGEYLQALQEDQDGRAALLRDLTDAVQVFNDRRRREIEETTADQVEQLRVDLEEARRRYRERYGEELSLAPCPAFIA